MIVLHIPAMNVTTRLQIQLHSYNIKDLNIMALDILVRNVVMKQQLPLPLRHIFNQFMRARKLNVTYVKVYSQDPHYHLI